MLRQRASEASGAFADRSDTCPYPVEMPECAGDLVRLE